MTAYQVVRDYNGHVLTVGNGYKFHTRELAEKYLRNVIRNYPWYAKDNPYVIQIEANLEPLPDPVFYNGKQVYDWKWIETIDTLDIGDYVSEDLAIDQGECVPPAWYSETLIQCGEPFSHDKKGATYSTYVKVDDGVWEYRGNCHRGETTES